ncbi:hypothetical protein GBAR_LOCUS19874, partial [Geodia barretti]
MAVIQRGAVLAWSLSLTEAGCALDARPIKGLGCNKTTFLLVFIFSSERGAALRVPFFFTH